MKMMIKIGLVVMLTVSGMISGVRASDNAEDLQMVYTQVRQLIDAAEYDRALSLLKPYTEEPLKYPVATSDYIVILVWSGRNNEAIRMFESLPLTFTFRAYLLRNIAKAYFDEGQYTRAAFLYESALQREPEDIEAQKGLLMSLVEAGEYKKAEEVLQRYSFRDEPEMMALHADLLFKKGEYLSAFRVFDRLKTSRVLDAEEVNDRIDKLLASLGPEETEELYRQLSEAGALNEYIVALAATRRYAEAIKVYEDNKDSVEPTNYLLTWLAWAYFKEGETDRAKEIYREVLENTPGYLRAEIGLAYCLGRELKFKEAMDRLRPLPERDIRVSFAKAYVYEKVKKFWEAIEEYDRILEQYPDHRTAYRLRLIALSDLGASSVALQKAYLKFPDDKPLHITFIGDLAVDRITWKEPEDAKRILRPLLADRDNLRAKFDYIVALAENSDMQEVIKHYKDLLDREITPPWWVLENVAKAYLYLEKPKKALELYNLALQSNPYSYNGRLGKFYTLQELRRFNEARQILDELEKEQPDVYWIGKTAVPNWKKLEVAVIRGWMLAYEERLKESEEYFWRLREEAPANMGIRTGLAHVYLWRGWPRKALREFRIIQTMESHNVKARIGLLDTMNQLAYKEEARQGAKELAEEYPKDKHVQQLVRRLEVEEMTELRGDFVYYRDEDGYEDIRIELKLTQPVTLYTRLYGFLHWQQSYEDPEDRHYYYRRVGIGVEHIFNAQWWARQHFSIDYDTRDDFGSYTEVVYTPDDYWRFALSYDTFTTDIPVRARAYGIDARKLEADITYRESEWREYGVLLSYLDFSDGNQRYQGMMTYEQGLYVRNNWRFRFFLELYGSKNTKKDAPYFNPEYDMSLSATLMTEYTHWRIYNKAFLQKLFLSAGMYKQAGYSARPIWSIRYEQVHDFSDTQALLLGLVYSRNVYDGRPVYSYAFYLTYKGRF